MELTHIPLFAGIGGDTLAAQWAGFRTVLFVEIDKFCQKVLAKNFPGVPILGDIKDVTREKIREVIPNSQCNGEVGNEPENWQGRGIEQEDKDVAYSEQPIRTSEIKGKPKCEWEGYQVGNEYSPSSRTVSRNRGTTSNCKTVTLITGGFPCQPVSHAGKRKGEADDRWLWPEMFRVISEVRPTWVVAENVTGLLHMGFEGVLADLESIGYETLSLSIPACGVYAPHRRQRIFIVGYSEYNGQPDLRIGELQGIPDREKANIQQLEETSDVADTISQRGCSRDSGRQYAEYANPRSKEIATRTNESWWAVEPDVGRVAYGIPSRVDRLKGLGNAIVPQQIYPILKGIADIERMKGK